MLTEIKKHCPDGKYKRIGSGTYCEAFKFFYNKDECKNQTETDSCQTIDCIHCKQYPHSGNYVIKEIQKTNRYKQTDFYSEVINQQHAMQYMPDLIINIYESWNEEFTLGTDGNIIGNLGTKTNAPKNASIVSYSYITMEYMNYKDLYLNYKSGKPVYDWSTPINMIGLVFICLVILYNLHCKLAICHGDFRDTNIFLKYISPEYQQQVNFLFGDKPKSFMVNTGGFHIKLGDFGLAETLCAETNTFIFRDYEFLENIYRNRECWKWMMPISEYTRLISFLESNFIININQRMDYYHYSAEQPKSRTDFWYDKHVVSAHSAYLYEFPKLLLRNFMTEFYS